MMRTWMKKEGRWGRVRKCAYCSTFDILARVRYMKKADGKQREGDNSREGNRVDRFAKVFPYTGSVAHEFFRPFEVSRSNSGLTNQVANVDRKTGPTLYCRFHTLGCLGILGHAFFWTIKCARTYICKSQTPLNLIFLSFKFLDTMTVGCEKT